ncbi:MAG: S-methyl-5-thioribose-1-phosphate isomerase [Candidatus Krumholzibacteriota bacterium]|nr:S-methyl-5-thioribose-1-phosphate isomerase [Candidatus Krumholzibacteriota bacterium]
MLIETIDYKKGVIRIIDQTLLPEDEKFIDLCTLDEVAEAICSLRIRGAPAIGIAASYGLLLHLDNMIRSKSTGSLEYAFDREEGMRSFSFPDISSSDIKGWCLEARKKLEGTRPTAVNLFWALERMFSVFGTEEDNPRRLCEFIARKAFKIFSDEIETELKIGENGAPFIRDGMNILTHCNAGGLATAGYGTALAVLYTAKKEGKRFSVYADETRPLLQGARLTVWELDKNGIDVSLLCDDAAASLFAAGRIDAVIVGADRIASNGDAANKIGTLGLAILCRVYRKPFYIAAPLSTFDMNISKGEDIPVEQRSGDELSNFARKRIVPENTNIYNPAFDVTPSKYITSIITERGVIENPGREKISSFMRLK